MFEVIVATLNKWNSAKNERQKLQHSYLALSISIILLAGIIGLFNSKLGHGIAKLALIAITTFAVNALVWNLLQSSLFEKLSSKPKRS